MGSKKNKEKKVRKKKQNKKNSIQVKVTKITKTKVVDSALKNQKPFFINIGNYRNISVQNLSTFCQFSARKILVT